MTMQAKVDIAAGICGFRTTAGASSEDCQNVTFSITSDCEKIRALAMRLQAIGPIDAYQEISPVTESVLLAMVRETLKGCCAGCAVPAGLFKSMQVAAGLALPQDIVIRLSAG
jgi:hypothetical protein